MANIFKPRLTRYFGPDGHRLTASKAKDINGNLLPGVRIKRERAKKWYGQYRDHNGDLCRVPLCTDKDASRAMLSERVTKAAKRQAGQVDPFEEHNKLALSEHLAAYRRHLENKGNCEEYIAQVVHLIELILDASGIRRLPDLNEDAVERYLHNLKETGRSNATFNYHLTAIKGFCRWLVKTKRMAHSPLAHLSKLNEEEDVRRQRRALPTDEFRRLIEAASGSKDVFRKLSGMDRAMLYTVAAYTGLRAGELASLESSSLKLSGDPPVIELEAAYSKRRRRDAQPIPEWLVTKVMEWLATKPVSKAQTIPLATKGATMKRPPSPKLWPGSWPDRAAEMLRADLAAARAAWIEEAPTVEEQQEREESSALQYEDQFGQVFDFHALRHQFISNLAAADVHPKVAQQLARHSSIELTMKRYTHLFSADVTGALDRLPDMSTRIDDAQAGRATGTDGRRIEPDGERADLVALRVVLTPGNPGDLESLRDHEACGGKVGQEMCKPLQSKGLRAEGTGLEPATPLLGHHISSVAASHSLTLQSLF